MSDRCTRCILPNTYPGITFNNNGVCNYCTNYEDRWNNWTEKESTFINILKTNNQGKYKAIIGLSGGKDSTYVLHKIVKEYGIKDVLAFTYDNGFLSDGAKKNIDKIVNKLNVDYEYHRMPIQHERNLYQKIIEKKSSELCMLCMNPTVNIAIALAKKHQTKSIVLGGSPRTEPQFPLTMINAFDHKYLESIVGKENCSGELEKYFKYSRFSNSLKLFLANDIKFINLPIYIDWNPFEFVEILKNEYEWVDYGGGIPHFDCMLEPLIDFFMFKRLGFSKIVDNISVLVRRGLITRDEAIIKYKKEEIVNPPSFFIDEFCNKINISKDLLIPYINGDSLDYQNFDSNANTIKKIIPILRILYKINLIPEMVYKKYTL
jgi:hypothetical protein